MASGLLGAQAGRRDPTGLSLEPGSSEATPIRKPCQGDPTPPQLTAYRQATFHAKRPHMGPWTVPPPEISPGALPQMS